MIKKLIRILSKIDLDESEFVGNRQFEFMNDIDKWELKK